MNAIVIEHVPVADLPQAWRDKLAQATGTRVTVRIEAEEPEATKAARVVDLPAGVYRDSEDVADVADYLRSIRAPCFRSEG